MCLCTVFKCFQSFDWKQTVFLLQLTGKYICIRLTSDLLDWGFLSLLHFDSTHSVGTVTEGRHGSSKGSWPAQETRAGWWYVGQLLITAHRRGGYLDLSSFLIRSGWIYYIKHQHFTLYYHFNFIYFYLLFYNLVTPLCVYITGGN